MPASSADSRGASGRDRARVTSALSGRRAFLASALPALLLFSTYCDVGLNVSDEGAWVSAAWVLRQGLDPFVDYLFPHPSLMPWVYAALFAVAGEDLLAVRALWAVVRAAACGLVSLAALRAMPGAGALALVPAAFLALAGGPWHKSHVALGLAAGAWLLLRLLDRPTAGRGLALGAAQGAALSVDLLNNLWGLPGTAAALGVAVAAGGDRPAIARASGGWVAGVALGAAPLAVAMVPRLHAFRLPTAPGSSVPFDLGWIAQASYVGWPGLASAWGRGDLGALGLASGALLDGAALLPAVGLAHGVRLLVRAPRAGANAGAVRAAGLRRVALSALAAGVVAKIAMRADVPHLLQNAVPLALLASVLAWDAARWAALRGRTGAGTVAGGASPDAPGAELVPARRLAAGALAAAAGLLVLVSATYPDPYYTGSVAVLRHAETRIRLPRAPLRERASVARTVEAVDAFVRANTRPEDTLFALPTCPLFHFLTERRNATHLVWVNPIPVGWEPIGASFVHGVETTRPPFVLWDVGPFTHGDRASFGRAAPDLVRYLDEAYQPVAAFGPYELRRRVAAAAPDSASRDESAPRTKPSSP